jgi:hypothetical protein
VIKNNRKRNYALLAVFATAVALRTNATLIAYEGFDAVLGPLSGQEGSTSSGWATGSSWSVAGTGDVVAAGLQSPASVNTIAGGSLQKINGTAMEAIRPFNPVTLTTGQDIFFSFLERDMGGSLSYILFNFQGQAFYTQIYPGGFVQAGIPNIGTIGTLPTSLTNPLLIVGQIQVNNAITHDYTLTVSTPSNPDVFGSPLTVLSTASGTTLPALDSSINRVLIHSEAADPAFKIDEIRIGTSIGDVYNTTVPVPEPATLAVLALGAFGALRKRRQ